MDASSASSSTSSSSTSSLSSDHLKRLNRCLFSPDLTTDDIQRWYDQGFTVGGTDTVFGLKQKSGGPCGVLAAVQGYLLARLFFQADLVQITTDIRNNKTVSITAPSSTSTTVSSASSSSFDVQFLGNDIATKVEEALVYALSFCIWQTSLRSSVSTLPLQVVIGRIDVSPLPYTASTSADHYRILTCSTFSELCTIVQQYLPYFVSDNGVIFLLYSMLLTRTIDTIQNNDMDETVPLIARFSHCTQELLNLCLTGEAITNIFDGIQYIGGNDTVDTNTKSSNSSSTPSYPSSPNVSQGLALKGLTRQPIIGYLSQLEALRYGKVGNFYKTGVFPVWVIGSESHFSILFSLQLQANEETPSSKIFRIFSKYDANDNQFVPIESLPSILNDLNLSSVLQNTSQYTTLKSALDTTGAGIITWSEFWFNIAPLLHGTSTSPSSITKPIISASTNATTKPRNAQDIANDIKDTVTANFFTLDTDGGGFLQIPKIRTLLQTITSTRKVLELNGNEINDIVKQLIGTDTEAYAIVFMEQLINSLEPFIVRQATKEEETIPKPPTNSSSSSSSSAVLPSSSGFSTTPPLTNEDSTNNSKKRTRTDDNGKPSSTSSTSTLPLDPQAIPLFDLSMFGPVTKKGNKTKKPETKPSSSSSSTTSSTTTVSSTVPSSSSLSSSSSSATPSLYEPPSVSRTINLWHYNGLVDKQNRQPKLVHITIEQIDTGLPLIETHSNTLAIQAAMSSQLGNIEEQMATAIALSSLSNDSSPSSAVRNDPMMTKALQNRNYARDSAVVESILRTKWVITKISYDPYPPSIN